MLAPGDVVANRYRVERALGEGGMGAVYVAVQEPLGRKVALKVIRKSAWKGNEDAETLMRFLNEARAVAQLSCPHVVALYDYGEHDGAPYIAMELLDGETLRARLAKGRASVDDVLSWARDIACGLRLAHENGIVHRDLKPENVMLIPDRDRGVVAKLLDFGIAKQGQNELTPGGAVFGTPGYIAPEVAVGGKSDDPRGDVYAFGVVLYEALCNAPPFATSNVIATMMAHLHEPVPDPRDARGDIPHAVAALVMSAMAKDSALRPQNGAALVEELDKIRAAALPTQALTPSAFAALTPEIARALGVAAGASSSRTTPGAPGAPGTGPTSGRIDRPSVAVQPFMALAAGNDDDVLFAEGISEDILTALSCFKQLFVVAQTSMWQKGGRETDALRVGRTLGVRYVVGGTVRRSNDFPGSSHGSSPSGRVRINASLVDVDGGAHLWAQRFDRPLLDLFAVQDEVTQAIVACVAGHVEKNQAESARKKPQHALAVWELVAKGRALHHRRTFEDNTRAVEAIDRAVQIDPDYAQAHAWRACILGQRMVMIPEDRALAGEMVKSNRTALALDDGDAECQRLAAELAILEADLDRAEHHHRRAIALNPNDARIVGQRGELSLLQGHLDVAADALERAMRLDALNPQPYMRHLACVRFLEDNVADASTIARHLADERIEMLALAAAIAAVRSEPDAEALVARVKARDANWSSSSWARPFARAEHREKWLSAFAGAGLAKSATESGVVSS